MREINKQETALYATYYLFETRGVQPAARQFMLCYKTYILSQKSCSNLGG